MPARSAWKSLEAVELLMRISPTEAMQGWLASTWFTQVLPVEEAAMSTQGTKAVALVGGISRCWGYHQL